MRARKLRLRPTQEQKKLLHEWAGCVRYTYNRAIEVLNNPKEDKKTCFAIRDRFVTVTSRKGMTNTFFLNKPWLSECPKAIRKGAVDDAITAYKAAHSNLRNGNIQHFQLRFRSKKTRSWSMTLEKANVKKDGDSLKVFPKLLGNMRYYSTKQLHKLMSGQRPDMDCKIQRDRYGDFFLVLPSKVQVQSTPRQAGIVSIDPGIRKFLTLYSPDQQTATLIGSRFMDVLMPLLQQADTACGRMIQSSGKARDKWKRRLNVLRKRIHNLKTELVYQSAAFIAQNHSLVLMPKLPTTILAARPTTTKWLARELYNSRHCHLFEHLRQVCLHRGVQFLEVGEDYTSQTCHRCGHLHKTDQETRTCPSCHYEGDRDVIAALNILLKAIR